MKIEKLPMVTVEFKSMPSFRCLLSEWEEMGGYRGYLKSYSITPRWIKEVRKEVLPATEYPRQVWEG
jgi:hypothetical protein